MKLIIFANRADPSSLGGLSSLLSDHMNKFLNYDVFVIGWNGNISHSRDIQSKNTQGVTYITISLNQWEYDNGYINFHNRFLWPLCHKFLSYVHYTEEGFKANQQISQLFLSLALDIIDKDTTIIVQDYHLIPLGKLIKSQFRIKVGFYLHIPMFDKTSLDRFSSPQTQELVECFKAYDYIGFQRGDDVKKFATHVSSDDYNIQPYQLLDVDGYKLCWNPVGIDLQKYQTHQPQLGDDKIRFIFAGRYDYIKGHVGFLNSIYTLLEQKVLDADRIVVLLIGGESRGDIKEYKDYQNQIKQLINKINKKYKCIQELGKIPRESLGQLLSSAENQYRNGGRQIVMCPSFMDGQNLIVHEAIAASPYNIVVSSEGSGCIEVVGRDNILYLKQHDFNNYKLIITEALNISMDKQVRRNYNVLERLEDQFNSSQWLQNIITTLNRKTLIFDIDGTISDLVENPNDAFIHEQFFDFIEQTNHNIIILTGREHSHGSNLAAKDMLMNKNLRILSSHGLLYTDQNNTYEHPLFKQIKPIVQKIHQEVDTIMKSDYMRKKNIIVEKKLLGVTINASFEIKEQQIKIFSIFRSMFRKLLYKQPFEIADEHCSIEIRPNIGKLQGYKYFIEDQLYNEQVIFFCDSLGTSGTDFNLAQYLTTQGHQVWQVKNNQPDYPNARKMFDNPLDLCQHLLFNVIHL